QPTVTPSPTTRSKFPFTSTASAYKKLKARDLDILKSQEVVRIAIYIMKRSRLEFSDPYTCERVHTEGEKASRQQRTRVFGHADPSSQQLQRDPTAAQVYSNKDFHIGDSVLHNRSYPLTRHVESLIAIAAFCARASALRRRPRTEGASIGLASPTASALDMASASIAGSKWLAKLGQVMFGGVCAQAGHPHHRRTRASLELLEQQNIELGQKILAEQQQQRQQKRQGQASSPTSKTLAAAESVLSSHASQAEELKPSEPGLFPSSISLRSPGPGSLSHSTSTSALSLSVVSTGTTHSGAHNASTSTSTSTSTPLNDKWCKHCSRAMSCLVIIAVQESNGSLVGGEDLGVSLEDTGLTSSAMDTLNVIQSLSSSTSSLNDSPVDRRALMDPASDLSRRQHDPSSSPYILFSRSHDPDDDMIRSSTGPAAKASSTLSQSLADAFGSELASAGGSSENPPTRGHSSSSGSSNSGRSSNNNNNNNNNNRIKKIINAGLQRPTADESDLELVSRTGSGLPSTGMSMESSCTVSTRAGSGSWQETSPAVQESRSQVQSRRNSPRLIPTTTTTRASSAGTTPSSSSSGTRRLEMDLAEAVATPSPGSVSSFSSLPAITIGIQPSLESLASAASGSSSTRRRSQVSSRRPSAEEGMLEQDAETATARVEEATKVASSSTGLSHSSRSDSPAAAADESSSQSLSRSSSSRINKLQSSSTPPSSAADSQQQKVSISSSNTNTSSGSSPPSPSAIIVSREVSRQDSQDEVEKRAAAAPLEHHSFYALGIHGQTSTDSYAREIEESMSRPPPTESSRSIPSSTASSSTCKALEKSGSHHERASDDDVGDVEDAEDATEAADEQHETAAATRHLDKDDSGSRETKLGSDSESEDETSSPQMLLAPPSKKEVSSPQGSSEAEQDDNDESQNESENEDENDDGSEQGLDVQQESSPSSSSLVTRPFSTASSSTLLTDDSFLSSLGSSSSTTHERGHGYGGDDDDDEEESHGGDDEDDEDGENSPRLDSSFALSGSDRQPLTREERKQEQKRLQRRKRRLLVDDAKRKQEQLDRIKAQLQLKDLGKIRQQVSFWEEKGVLEQKVVAMVEVEEEEEEEDEKKPEEAEKKYLSSKDELSSSGKHRSADDLQAPEGREHDARDKTVVIQGKMADVMLGEPLSPGNSQLSGYDEPPKPAARNQQGSPDHQRAASASSESDLAVFLSDID
ncbi:hypothetical protein BGZ75_002484, partial [Mortierella antarctica]